jgi:hypothetical protein
VKARSIIVALLAFWLAFGPAASAWAQSLEKPCESMSMTMTHDGCGDGMDQTSCLGACLTASPAISVVILQTAPADPTQSPVLLLALERASVLAPPDVAPPKSFLS